MDISGFIQHVKKNRCRLRPETQMILFQTVVTHGYKGRKIEEALTKCCPNKFRSMMRQLIKSIPHCPKAYSAGEALRLLLEDFASQRFISPRDIREIILEVSLNNEGRITEIQASYGGTQALFYEDFQEIKLLVKSLSATQLKNLIDELEYHGQNYSIDSLRIDICDTVIGHAEELRFWCNRSKVFLKAGGETQLLSVVKNLTVSHEYCKERISLSTYPAFVERLTLICSKIRENEPIKQLEPLIKKNTSLLYDFYMLEISDIEELFRAITQKDHQKLSELIEGYAIESETIQKFKEDLQLCIKHVDQGFKRQYITSIIKFSKNHLNKKSSIFVSEISNLSSNSEKSKLREQLNEFRTILHFDMRMEDSEIVYLFNRILFHQSTGLQQILQRQRTKEKYKLITSLKNFLKSIPQEMYQELNLHRNFPKIIEGQQSNQQDSKRQFQANKTGQYQMLNYQQNKQQSTPKSSSLIISQRQMIQNQTRAPILLSPLKPAEVYNENDAFEPIDANIILTQIKLLQKSDDISGMIILLSKDKISKYQIKQLSTNKQIIPLQSNLSFNNRYIKILYFKGKINGSYWFQTCFQSSFFSLYPRKQPKQITLSIKHEDIYINSILFYIDCEQIQPLEGQQRTIYQTARSYALYQSISFVVQKIHVKEDIAKTCIFPWLKIVSEKFKTLELDQQQIFVNRQALIQSCLLKSGKSFQSTHFCIYLFCSLYDNRDWQELLKFQFLSKIILPAQLVSFQNRQYPNSRPFQYFWMKLVLYNDIICPSRKEQSRIKKLLLANMEFLPYDELKVIFQYVAKENIEVLVKMDHQLRQYFLSNLSFSAYEYWKIKMQYIKRIFNSQEPSQQQEYVLRFMDDMITMLKGDYKRISQNMINQSQNIKMLFMKQGSILFKSSQLRINDKIVPQLYIKCKIIRLSSNYLLDFVPTILPSLQKNIRKLMQNQFIKIFFSLLVNPSQWDKKQLINLVSKQHCKISSMKSILEKLLQYTDADIDYFKILAKEFSKNNGRQTLKILPAFNKLYTNATTQSHKNIFKQLFSIFLKGNTTQMRKGMNKKSFENPQSRFIEDIVFYQNLTVPQIQQLYLKQLFCPLIEQFKEEEWIIVMIIDQAFINPDGKNCFHEILHFYLEIIGGLKAKNIQNIIKKYLLKQISNISYLQKYPQQHKKGLELFINNIKSQRFTAPQIRKMHEGTHRFYFQPKSTKALDQAINKLIKFQENVKKAKAFLIKNYSHFKIYIVRLIKYEGRMKLMKLYEAYKLDDRDDFLVDNIAKIELFYKLPVVNTYTIKTDTQLILTFEAVDKLFISELDKIRAQSITYKSFRNWFCQQSSDHLLIQYCVSKELIQAIKRYRAFTFQQCKELHDSLKSIQFIEYLIKSHNQKEKVVEDDTFVSKISQNGGQILLKELQGQIISYKQAILSTVQQLRIIQLNSQQLSLQLQRLMPLEIMQKTYKLKAVFLKMVGIKIDTSIEMDNQQIKIMGNIVLINQYLQLISSCKNLEDYCRNFSTFSRKNQHFEATLQFCIDNQPKIIELLGLMRKEEALQTSIVLEQ